MLGLLRHCVYLQHDFPEDFGLNLLVSLPPYDKQLVNHTFGKGLHQSQSPTPGPRLLWPCSQAVSPSNADPRSQSRAGTMYSLFLYVLQVLDAGDQISPSAVW